MESRDWAQSPAAHLSFSGSPQREIKRGERKKKESSSNTRKIERIHAFVRLQREKGTAWVQQYGEWLYTEYIGMTIDVFLLIPFLSLALYVCTHVYTHTQSTFLFPQPLPFILRFPPFVVVASVVRGKTVVRVIV